METSLHRQLKELYAGPKARFEVPVAGYRVDVVNGRRLVEIQHGRLAAIRDKVRTLLESHRVLVVKPIVRSKVLVKLSEAGGDEVSRRMSPKRGRLLDLFEELVHFTRVFPHPRLTLEAALVDVEEHRYPGHGRRRRWRENDHQVEDQRLLTVHQTVRLQTVDDLASLLGDAASAAPADRRGRRAKADPSNRRASGADSLRLPCPALPCPFHTGHLAALLGEPRWIAQRIAYCLLHMGGLEQVGKDGNARLYRWPRRAA